MERLPEFAVEPCFLELAEPDIPTAVHRLMDRGIRQLTVAPLLLFAAGHAKRDIPMAVAAAIKVRGGPNDLQIVQLPPLECHARIVELSTLRFNEALRNRRLVACDDTMLLLVARGSSYPEALAEMQRFARLRHSKRRLDGPKCALPQWRSPIWPKDFAEPPLRNIDASSCNRICCLQAKCYRKSNAPSQLSRKLIRIKNGSSPHI